MKSLSISRCVRRVGGPGLQDGSRLRGAVWPFDAMGCASFSLFSTRIKTRLAWFQSPWNVAAAPGQGRVPEKQETLLHIDSGFG